MEKFEESFRAQRKPTRRGHRRPWIRASEELEQCFDLLSLITMKSRELPLHPPLVRKHRGLDVLKAIHRSLTC